VRLYPLRGDSLSFFSALYARRAEEARLFRRALRFCGIRNPEAIRVPPERSETLVAELLGTAPRRDGGAPPTDAERRAARIVRWLPSGHLGELYYPYWDWDEPPFFKCFLRVDATHDEIRFRCFAATGCAEHEDDPPLEDEFVWTSKRGWTERGS
jgi:hypothetical protein